MKIKTSYFYQIRNFTPDIIPVSTALWDPKWYHDFKDSNHIWIDKNGVVNGLRMPHLAPRIDNNYCMSCDHKDPSNCKFQSLYKEQLMNLNKDEILSFLDKLSSISKLTIEPTIALIVHEDPLNPCSERSALQEYFSSLGFDCTELEL